MSLSQFRKQSLLGPIDKIIRSTMGFVLLVIAYILPFTVLEFAVLHMGTVYLWVSSAVAWDPFYAVIAFLFRRYRDRAAINGHL